LRPQDCNLLIHQPKHEVGGKPLQVPPHLFVQPFGGDAVERREILVEQHLLATDDEDATGDPLGRDERRALAAA